MLTLPELIDQLLNVRQLPTISSVALVLEQSLNEEEPEIQRISRIISEDPAITSMVLKLANSALYGARRTFSSIQDAVMRLGFQEIRKMVMALAIVEYLVNKNFDMIDPPQFFSHSIGVASGMELINSTAGMVTENSNQLYVIGLLHDLGRWVTANYLPEVHQHIMPENNTESENKDIIKLERQNIGLDHAQIAAALLERWGLPLTIVQGVRFHHEPDAAPEATKKLSRLIYLVDNLCMKHKIGEVGEGLDGQIPETAWKRLGLSPDAEERILPQIKAVLEHSEVLLSIGGYRGEKARQ
ncbi:MAG: HDOD domain-containing protein [Candidatus Glassbacteria bacterium]|nr:HDOD domain-containing protein [Candidatus Glassbacteria bacterium]